MITEARGSPELESLTRTNLYQCVTGREKHEYTMASKEIHYPSSSVSPSSNSTSPTPESFVLETKFIVLNFMSRNPHERHPGCVYSSTSKMTFLMVLNVWNFPGKNRLTIQETVTFCVPFGIYN
jgi:hypothetical protein